MTYMYRRMCKTYERAASGAFVYEHNAKLQDTAQYLLRGCFQPYIVSLALWQQLLFMLYTGQHCFHKVMKPLTPSVGSDKKQVAMERGPQDVCLKQGAYFYSQVCQMPCRSKLSALQAFPPVWALHNSIEPCQMFCMKQSYLKDTCRVMPTGLQ